MGIAMDPDDMPASNPLPPPPPPPPRRHGRGSNRDNGVRMENLSNADFRRMVIETPRRGEEHHKERKGTNRSKRGDEEEQEGGKKPHRKYRPKPKEEEKQEEPDLPKYRDRAKERREDQNPDYDQTATELGSLHAVAPPGTVDLRTTDAQRISIENSKFLGGDVEHTHLVKGLDFALLHKVRSELDRKPDSDEPMETKHMSKEDEAAMNFRTAAAKLIYQWTVKPQTVNKVNEMFLPGRTAFIFNMAGEAGHDIPTTVQRSKADCPPPEETVAVGVDGSVLERIAKIMAYLRLGSSGKSLKKKRKDKGAKGSFINTDGHADADTVSKSGMTGELDHNLPPPPPLGQPEDSRHIISSGRPRNDGDDIFEGAGADYVVTMKNRNRSPASEDMEESPRERQRQPYFQDTGAQQEWNQQVTYDTVQAPALPSYPGEWAEYPAPPPEQYAGPWQQEQYNYPEQYYQNQVADYAVQAGTVPSKDPRFMTQEEKDRGMGSVFKRDDQRLQQRRELDAREKDPNFISESYSECYPGYQEYNREVVDSDDEEDLTKMDMGGRAKGRLHRWDFETEEEWAKYNEQKEAMPKAAFQFGVKMQDGRKTRKQNKDQKLTNELHKINQILDKKKKEKTGSGYDDEANFEEESHPGKRLRV